MLEQAATERSEKLAKDALQLAAENSRLAEKVRSLSADMGSLRTSSWEKESSVASMASVSISSLHLSPIAAEGSPPAARETKSVQSYKEKKAALLARRTAFKSSDGGRESKVLWGGPGDAKGRPQSQPQPEPEPEPRKPVFWFAEGKQRRGPFLLPEFVERIRDGEIGAECSVWTKVMPEWVTLDEACGPEPQMPLEVAAAYLLAQHPASPPAGAGTPEAEGSLEAMMAAAGASAQAEMEVARWKAEATALRAKLGEAAAGGAADRLLSSLTLELDGRLSDAG